MPWWTYFLRKGDMLLVCFYVDDCIFTKQSNHVWWVQISNGSRVWDDQRGLMSYYLDIEMKQTKNDIFISQEGHTHKKKESLIWICVIQWTHQ